MAKVCLFCPNVVDSGEHVWSDWILEDLKPVMGIRVQIGMHTDRFVDDPEVIINCVCHTCNNGWMSDLETANKPHIRPMMHNEQTILHPQQQKLLARWALLKAAVLESANRKRKLFYSDDEREGLKPPSCSVPVGTRVWLGRLAASRFHAGGTDIWGEINKVSKAAHGNVTTFVIGHLVIQVLTLHVIPMFEDGRRIGINFKSGAWDENLLTTWPVFGQVVWPPKLSFTLGGADSIAGLINRWKIGMNLGK